MSEYKLELRSYVPSLKDEGNLDFLQIQLRLNQFRLEYAAENNQQ
jgi:hypothetical protein